MQELDPAWSDGVQDWKGFPSKSTGTAVVRGVSAQAPAGQLLLH